MEINRIKILYVINFLGGGGVEKFLIDLVNRLDKKKYDIEVLLLMNYKETYPLESFENIKIVKFNGNNIYSFGIIIHLINYLRKNKFDIIHVNLFPAQLYVSLVKKIIKGKFKLITTEHGISERRKKNRICHFLEKWSYGKYDKIIGVSDIVREKLIEEYPEFKKKTITIENGINVEKFYNAVPFSRENFGLTNKDIILSMVGRLDVGKDQLTIIKALQHLPKNYKFIIVGTGNQKEELEKNIKQLKLEKRILFTGFVKNIERIYKLADINILSTYSEGLPLVVLEAMASKKPFLGSNVEGVKQLVNNVGVLFEYKNEKDLVEKILMLDEEEYYNKISNNCYEYAKKFEINIMVERYEKIYLELGNEIKNR